MDFASFIVGGAFGFVFGIGGYYAALFGAGFGGRVKGWPGYRHSYMKSQVKCLECEGKHYTSFGQAMPESVQHRRWCRRGIETEEVLAERTIEADAYREVARLA